MGSNLMKTTATVFLTLLFLAAYGQSDEHEILLDSAKTLFKGSRNLNQEELDSFDYQQVASLLEGAIELNPENAEARYFLGYTYSRMNSPDGRGLIHMNPHLLQRSSEQIEKVISLTPKYTGEIIVLDPYSKLTAEWGSMAVCYWHNNQMDSAIWAFREGKMRGGFGDFILELNRRVLDACDKNSILISAGDNYSIPILYLQVIENYRKDVSVVDIHLLNTGWYPAFLSRTQSVLFDLPSEVIDTMEYIRWADTTIAIRGFSWTVHPSYADQYMLRGDRLFLSLLKENEFRREVYFTKGFDESNRLSLADYLTPLAFVDQLSVYKPHSLGHSQYKKAISKALELAKLANPNSPDELVIVDNTRYDVLSRINSCLSIGDKKKAAELMELLDKLVDEKKYPFQNEDGKNYAEYLRQKI